MTCSAPIFDHFVVRTFRSAKRQYQMEVPSGPEHPTGGFQALHGTDGGERSGATLGFLTGAGPRKGGTPGAGAEGELGHRPAGTVTARHRPCSISSIDGFPKSSSRGGPARPSEA